MSLSWVERFPDTSYYAKDKKKIVFCAQINLGNFIPFGLGNKIQPVREKLKKSAYIYIFDTKKRVFFLCIFY